MVTSINHAGYPGSLDPDTGGSETEAVTDGSFVKLAALAAGQEWNVDPWIFKRNAEIQDGNRGKPGGHPPRDPEHTAERHSDPVHCDQWQRRMQPRKTWMYRTMDLSEQRSTWVVRLFTGIN